MSTSLRVHSIETVETDTGLRLSCRLGGLPAGLPDELWYAVDSPAAPLRPPRSADFAACALLPAAMSIGAPLVVDGPVRSGLIRNLIEYAEAWNMWLPEAFSRVAVASGGPSKKPEDAPNEGGAVLAFSGGLDSAYALIGHTAGLFGARSLPISHAVMVHGFDIPLESEDTFARAAERAREQLAEFGIPLVTVRTNWRAFCIDWEMTHVAGLAGVLHLFDGTAARGIFAADYTYANPDVRWGSNPVTNHLLGSREFPLVISGYGTRRNDKAGVVARYPGVCERLRVCWQGDDFDRNCGRCNKCVITQLNFLAGGATPPSFLGLPDPELVRAFQTKSWYSRKRLDDQATDRDNLPEHVRAAFDEMLARERRRFPDPLVPESDIAAQRQKLDECRARQAELESSLRAVTSSHRIRLLTRALEPLDRARAQFARVAGRRGRRS